MSQPAAGTAPVPVPTAEPKSNTPAAPTPAPKDSFLDLVKSASTPAELRAATERLRNMQKPPANPPIPPQPDETGAGPKPAPKPAEKVAAEPAPAEPPAPEPPAEPATPPEEPPAEPETPPAPVPGEDDDEGTADDITPTKPGRNRLPLNEDDEVGRMAAAFKRRNRDWTLEQALEAAKVKLGKNKPADPAAPAKPKSDLPETVDAVNAAIADLRAQKRTAATELRIEDVATIDDKIFDLAQHRESLQRQAERQEVQNAAAYDRQFAASEAQAAELYEFAGDPESPGGKRMAEIDQALEETGDPRFNAPNKPLLIAQMVAAELKIAPKSKKAPAPAAKPAAPAPGQPPAPGKKSQIIPGGDSRTAPAAPAKNELETLIANAKTPAEVLAIHKRMGLGQ